MFDHLYLDICPPSLQSSPLPPTGARHPLRAQSSTASSPPPPAWLTRDVDKPAVYLTLGTVFNRNDGVFDTLLQGLRDEALNVFVTVGPDNDPAVFGPQPADVHVERYIDQEAVLPHVDAVVTHGGSGSMLGALAHGVPMLICLRARISSEMPTSVSRSESGVVFFPVS